MLGVKFKLSAFLTQASASLLIASFWCSCGLQLAWHVKAMRTLTSDHGRVLYRPMRYAEITIMDNGFYLAELLVTPLIAFALSFRRKYSIVIFGIPLVLAWIAIGTTRDVLVVIISYAVAGIGFAGRAVSLVYIAEIVQDSYRGCLSTFVLAELAFGTLFSSLPYFLIVYLNLTVSVLSIVLILFLKESPVLLLQKGKLEEAAKSIAFYRRVDVASKDVEMEINKIKLQLEPSDETDERDAELPITNKVKDNPPGAFVSKESSLQFLRKSSSSQRALGCVVFLVLTCSLLQTLINIAPFLLKKKLGISISHEFMEIIYLTAILICAGVVDCLGRKFLLKWTSLLLAVIGFAFAVQLTFPLAPQWVISILLYVYSFVCYLGVATVPTILVAEVFLPKVRGLCVAVAMSVTLISHYISSAEVINEIFLEIYEVNYIFYGMSILCFIVGLFSHFCLPETKGLSVDEIQTLFQNKGKIVEKPLAPKV